MSYQYIEKMPTTDEWISIRKNVCWSIEEKEDFKVAAKNTLYAVCVYDQNQIIGMGRVVGDNRICFLIQDIAVVPEYQHEGIGQKIMFLIFTYINSNASPNATIGLFSVLGKEDFYKKIGFIARPTKTRGCGMYIESSAIIKYINQYPNYKVL